MEGVGEGTENRGGVDRQWEFKIVEGGSPLTPSPVDSHHGGQGDTPIKEGEAGVLLQLERCAHRQTRKVLQEEKQKTKDLQVQVTNLLNKNKELSEDNMTNQMISKIPVRSVLSDSESVGIDLDMNLNSLESFSSSSVTSSGKLPEEIKDRGTILDSFPVKILFPSSYLSQLREMTISQLRLRVLQLEKAKLDKVPLDAAKEISRLNTSINFTLKSRLAEVASNINDPAATYQVTKDPPSHLKEISNTITDIQKLSGVDDPEVAKILRRANLKVNGESLKMRDMYSDFDITEHNYKKKINELEKELKRQETESTEKFDRHIRNLENQLEDAHKKLEVTDKFLLTKEEECHMEVSELSTQYNLLQDQLSKVRDENRVLIEDCNRERVLRKKYYNQIEEMKGKIRVFCRLRPITDTEERNGGAAGVTSVEDEFSVMLDTTKGQKTFNFDKVFPEDAEQEEVFEDTR
ncbi:Kinesin-related protein 2, partial [Armadillidium nasatum]